MKRSNYNIANKERRFNWVFFAWSSEYDCRNMYTIKLLKKKLFYQNHLQYSSSQSLFALGKLRQSAQDFVEIGQIKQHGILEEIGRFQAETCFASFEKQVYVAKTQELKTRNILLRGSYRNEKSTNLCHGRFQADVLHIDTAGVDFIEQLAQQHPVSEDGG